jgi:indolepyruvate ferredoxin oxidoreductase beta subunit
MTSPLSTDKPLSLAILAMGGQGGGVLADWIVALAEAQGYVAQATSVPGVAQRTGATIYYIEMLPERPGSKPVLSMMPTPGDVDIVMAAEFMEAGRSVLRGLVTPDRTVLIASTHRSFAVMEKEKPGDGIGDPNVVVEAAGIAAKRIVAFDMQTLAEKSGSVISAAMFGALAGAEVLPFPRSAFRSAIEAGGKGIEASVRTFEAAYAEVAKPPQRLGAPAKSLPDPPASAGHPELDRLLQRIGSFPVIARPMLYAGVKRLVDFQDPKYADDYLDRLQALHQDDVAGGGASRNFAFTVQGAKYLAIAMAYDDVIRVADLKTRASRFQRVRNEVGVKAEQLVYTTEFMHPRMEEVVGTLPAALGHFLEARPRLYAWLDRRVNRGRRVRTGTIFWFSTLYFLASLRKHRRSTLRHQQESAHIAAWLDRAQGLVARNYDLAVEVLICRQLVKGYSTTRERGTSKFDRVLSALPLLADKPDGSPWLARLRKAALMDEDGTQLDGALKTLAGAYGD